MFLSLLWICLFLTEIFSLLCVFIDLSTLFFAVKALLLILIAMLSLKASYLKINRNILVFFLLFILVGIMSFGFTNEVYLNFLLLLLATWLFNFAPNKQQLIKQIGWCYLIILLVLFGLFLLNLLPTVSTEIGDRVRNSLGFVNANNATILGLTIVAAGIYCRKRGLILFGATYLIAAYNYTDSRSSMLTLVICLLYWIFSKVEPKLSLTAKKVINTFMTFLFWFYISLIFLILLKPSLFLAQFPEIDLLLSGRIQSLAGINSSVMNLLFGWNNFDSMLITQDSFYWSIIFTLGMPLSFVLFVVIFKSLRFYHLQKNHRIVLIYILLLSCGFVERLISPVILPTVLVFYFVLNYVSQRQTLTASGNL